MATPVRQIQPANLNQKKAALHCGVSYSTFRRWRKLTGFPNPCVIGSLKLWRVVDLDAFLAGHRENPEVAR
jgi:predicted DNA-binding transcriptional regulator AlpA